MAVIFKHPFAIPTTTFNVRNPQLGNSEEYNIKTQFHLAMDATVYGTIDTPVNKTLLLTFTHLTKAVVNDFIAFFKVSAGEIISYTDHASNIWRGVIANNPFEASTDGRKDGACIEVSTVTIQFRGAIVDIAHKRILEDGFDRLLESGAVRLLEGV